MYALELQLEHMSCINKLTIIGFGGSGVQISDRGLPNIWFFPGDDWLLWLIPGSLDCLLKNWLKRLKGVNGDILPVDKFISEGGLRRPAITKAEC